MSMKLSGHHRKSNQPEKDKLLTIVLFFFNIWSGATTIIGASQVLPGYLAWLSGIAVQTMLFFLLAGWVMKTSFLRKWIAILAFSLFSVYTSFFCYYDVLTKDARERDVRTQALSAHQQLISTVFTPILEKERQLNTDYEKISRKANEECKTGLTTGEVGCGPVARQFQQKAIDLDSQRQSIQKLIKEISPKFNYKLDGMTAEEVFRKDAEAFSSVPPQFRPQGFQVDKSNYLVKIYDVNFLTPYYKVFFPRYREDAAVFAMLIALSIDGIAIIQGTAIENRRRRYSFLQGITIKVSRFIREVKSLKTEIGRAIKQPYGSIETYTHIDSFKREADLHLRNLSPDLVLVFASALNESIRAISPHTIDLVKLKTQGRGSSSNIDSSPILYALEAVLDVMEKHNFVVLNQTEASSNPEWIVKDGCYMELINWLQDLRESSFYAAPSDSEYESNGASESIDEVERTNQLKRIEGWQRVIRDFHDFRDL